ncbi:MAG TPA: hypothetical protein VM938_13635 [Acidimicrobiales bacterium]|nr:hypothetical protein [Acidimicrobiales bacterium]
MNTTKARSIRRIGMAAASVVAAVTMIGISSGSALAAPRAEDRGRGAPPSKAVSQAEQARGREVPNERVEREAKPLPTPAQHAQARRDAAPQEQAGPTERVEGAAPAKAPSGNTLSGTASAGNDQPTSSSGASQNSAWGGAYWTNPNLQVGRLFFDTQPGAGERWSWCSATAVNSENKSLVLTAGHCVFRPDPDGDGRITGNGFWYEHFRFCPGYEYGCRMGTWHYRQVSTTWSWHGGVGGSYDFRDDVAVLLVSPNASGNLVNYVGGHGISFNEPTNLYRHSFGYPATDSRWPAYSYSGEDLIHCPNYSYNDGTYAGTMWMSCTMTGGSSGGPWLTYVGSNWLGYVNSVNSHKPYGGSWMSGPYFDSQESSLFNYWRNR